MAILGLVFAFVFSPLGIVFSAIGLKQIKERREGGRGLALAGLILSIIFVVLGILIVIRCRDRLLLRGRAGRPGNCRRAPRSAPPSRLTTRTAWSPPARRSSPRS